MSLCNKDAESEYIVKTLERKKSTKYLPLYTMYFDWMSSLVFTFSIFKHVKMNTNVEKRLIKKLCCKRKHQVLTECWFTWSTTLLKNRMNKRT